MQNNQSVGTARVYHACDGHRVDEELVGKRVEIRPEHAPLVESPCDETVQPCASAHLLLRAIIKRAAAAESRSSDVQSRKQPQRQNMCLTVANTRGYEAVEGDVMVP
jgi:hypothetical protein